MTIELNRDNYEDEVFQSKGVMLVDFWGPKCAPCLALMPAVEKLEEQYEGKLKVGKLNATENRMQCAKLRVLGLPTFIVYKDGEELERLSGESLTSGEIEDAVKIAFE